MSSVPPWSGDPARRTQWERLLAWLDLRSGESFLDVGCGGGAAVAFAGGRVGSRGRAIGLERVPESLLKLHASFPVAGPAAPRGVCGDGQALPFTDDSFDAVLCVNVLEAIRDRPGALAEIWRVLKPGGRVLIAHDDYESQAYAGADRDLTRRAVYGYANSKIGSYETSDGQMGRQLWSLFSKAGFVEPEARILPLVNTEYQEPLLGWILAQFTADFVSAVSDLTQAELDRWHRELAAATERGSYFYCINLYACFGRKPPRKG